MITTELPYTVDLTGGVQLTPLRAAFFVGDEEAHRFVLRVVRHGSEEGVQLDGATVRGYLRREDGATVIIGDGSAQGHMVTVTLSKACYAVSGTFALVIRLEMDGVVSSIFWGGGTMNQPCTDAYVDPGETLPTLHELLEKVTELEETIAQYEIDPARIEAIEQDISILQGDVEALQNTVIMTMDDPGAGAAVGYPEGTVIHVYE